jgi:hypothetical protein
MRPEESSSQGSDLKIHEKSLEQSYLSFLVPIRSMLSYNTSSSTFLRDENHAEYCGIKEIPWFARDPPYFLIIWLCTSGFNTRNHTRYDHFTALAIFNLDTFVVFCLCFYGVETVQWVLSVAPSNFSYIPLHISQHTSD